MVFNFLFGKAKEITIEEFKTIFTEKKTEFTFIDVREPMELTGPMGFIPGVVNIPLRSLMEQPDTLTAYKEKTLIFICRSGARSHQATQFASQQGYKAKNLAGGMIAWKRVAENNQ